MAEPMRYLPTLRQLHYLVAVAEHRHFGKAADACAVTQSTLSAGLKELETALGSVLVERTKRVTMITPLGEEVVARARALLRDAGDIVALCRARAESLSGPLRLGVIPTIGPYLLPRVLPGLRAAYPDLRVLLREDQTEALLRRLESGALDAALIAMPYEIDGLAVVDIADEGFLLACPADHPLALAKGTVATSDLDPGDVMLLEEGHCLTRHATAACRLARSGEKHGGGIQATSLYTLVEMVASGLGVTLLPETAAGSELLDRSDVVLRRLDDAEGGRTVALVWRSANPRDGDFRALADAIRGFVLETDK